jgi:hypothetical protein
MSSVTPRITAAQGRHDSHAVLSSVCLTAFVPPLSISGGAIATPAIGPKATRRRATRFSPGGAGAMS